MFFKESDYAGKVDELKYQKPEKTVPVSLSKGGFSFCFGSGNVRPVTSRFRL